MRTIGSRRAAVLLVLLGLLFAAWPAAAAPERTPDEPGARTSLVHALAAWLAGLWPGAGPGPETAWEALGSGADPDGEPRATTPEAVWEALGPVADPDGEPQATTPEAVWEALGPDLDPGG